MLNKLFFMASASVLAATLLVACSLDRSVKPQDALTKNQPSASRPNIILILADDMGFADLSINGQTNFNTPHLDQLANEGINFTQFYSGAAVCGPSRSVLLTGQHQGHTRIRSNLMTTKDANGNKKLQSEYLHETDQTLGSVLKSAGYNTAIIGKWGLGEDTNAGHPNRQGFDYFFGYLNHVHAHNHFPDFLWRNYEKVYLQNKPVTVACDYCDKFGFVGQVTPIKDRKEYAGDLIRDESLSYIERSAKQSSPFFLFVSLVSPHANNEADKMPGQHGLEIPDYKEFAHKNWPDTAKGYAAMIRHIDDTVGALKAKLKEQGIDKNTLIVFTSDNGVHAEAGNDPEFHNSSGKFRGIKRDAYEGGAHTPMIAWAPGLVTAQARSNFIGYSGDFMETFAALAHATPPVDIDSMNF